MSVIKHPNGKYSVFSPIVDDFTYINITKEEYLKIRISEAIHNTQKDVESLFNRIEKCPESQGTLEDKLKVIESLHGKARKNEILRLMVQK